jgi:hypothetical protein
MAGRREELALLLFHFIWNYLQTYASFAIILEAVTQN